jgi:hypothetical protein
VLNDVALNQVLVSFGSPEHTRRVIAEIQQDGTCWCGGTIWHGHAAMRISVSCCATTDEDLEQSVSSYLPEILFLWHFDGERERFLRAGR